MVSEQRAGNSPAAIPETQIKPNTRPRRGFDHGTLDWTDEGENTRVTRTASPMKDNARCIIGSIK